MNATGIVMGGIIFALGLRLGTVIMRSSIAAGASILARLAVIGTTIALVGCGRPRLRRVAFWDSKGSSNE